MISEVLWFTQSQESIKLFSFKLIYHEIIIRGVFFFNFCCSVCAAMLSIYGYRWYSVADIVSNVAVAYVIKKSMCGLFILSIKINGAHISRGGDFLDIMCII